VLRIMNAYGKMPTNAAHDEYESGDLYIQKYDDNTIMVRFKGDEVMHTYLEGEGHVSMFHPDVWIHDVERIANSIPEEAGD
jgi:hypothetical protein